MVVAFIGSSDFRWTPTITKRFSKKITKLVKKDSARTFLFTGEGNFDLICWVIVTKLKKQYSDIKRVYARINVADSDDEVKVAELMYEQAFLLDAVRNAGARAELVRNEAIVDMCDVLVTYCNMKNKRMPRLKGYEDIAVEYAKQNNKGVINLFR